MDSQERARVVETEGDLVQAPKKVVQIIRFEYNLFASKTSLTPGRKINEGSSLTGLFRMRIIHFCFKDIDRQIEYICCVLSDSQCRTRNFILF